MCICLMLLFGVVDYNYNDNDIVAVFDVYAGSDADDGFHRC